MHKSQIAHFKVSNCIVQQQVQIKLKNPKVQLSAKNIKQLSQRYQAGKRRFWKDIKLSKKRDKYAEKIGYASNYTHFHHFPK